MFVFKQKILFQGRVLKLVVQTVQLLGKISIKKGVDNKFINNFANIVVVFDKVKRFVDKMCNDICYFEIFSSTMSLLFCFECRFENIKLSNYLL